MTFQTMFVIFFYKVENYVAVEASFKIASLDYEYTKKMKEAKIDTGKINLPSEPTKLDIKDGKIKDEKILALQNLWEEDQKIKERLQLEITSLRRDLNEKDIEIGMLDELSVKAAEHHMEDSEAKDEKILELKKIVGRRQKN